MTAPTTSDLAALAASARAVSSLSLSLGLLGEEEHARLFGRPAEDLGPDELSRLADLCLEASCLLRVEARRSAGVELPRECATSRRTE